MTPLNLIIISSIISGFVAVYESIISNNMNSYVYLFILFSTKIILLLYIYNFELTETDKIEIFSKKYIYTWINCVIVGLAVMFSLKLYLENHRKIGIGKSEVLKESIHIIIIFILSYLILGHKDINFEMIIGIIIIIFGMYLIQKNDKIII